MRLTSTTSAHRSPRWSPSTAATTTTARCRAISALRAAPPQACARRARVGGDLSKEMVAGPFRRSSRTLRHSLVPNVTLRLTATANRRDARGELPDSQKQIRRAARRVHTRPRTTMKTIRAVLVAKTATMKGFVLKTRPRKRSARRVRSAIRGTLRPTAKERRSGCSTASGATSPTKGGIVGIRACTNPLWCTTGEKIANNTLLEDHDADGNINYHFFDDGSVVRRALAPLAIPLRQGDARRRTAIRRCAAKATTEGVMSAATAESDTRMMISSAGAKLAIRASSDRARSCSSR